MKVAIFSDLHDNIPNLNLFLNWVKKNQVSDLIFCGDLANVATLKYLAESFTGKIYIVDGLVKFCIKHKLSHPNLSKVASGQRLHHKGWKAEKILTTE